MDRALLSTGKDNWETPKNFYEKLDDEFHFTLDPCCTRENAKCKKYYTKDDDGLSRDWGGEVVFCNPPYSKNGNQDAWVKKCYTESLKPNTTVVALLPARTDTVRFHDYILGKAEIRFIKGRLVFEVDGKPLIRKNGRPQPAPFPNMICIWR